MLLLQDNTSIHTPQITEAKSTNCGFELLPHPTYLLDLALSEFFLFPKLKSHLRGCHFGNNDEILCAVEEVSENQDDTFFCDEVAILKHC